MKILVTGGTGMVGSAFKNIETAHDLVLISSSDYDLKWPFHAHSMLKDHRPDAVIHLAARVGGVKGNSDYVADFFHDNIMINTNVLDAAKECRIPKVVSLLSTCIYPDKVTYPLTEDQIHLGEPHESNFGYAYAKRMLDAHSRAIRQQYGLNYVTVVPNNIYGPNDNFSKRYSHVIPAMIRNIYEAKIRNKAPVFWGTGRCLREFTFSEDIANILLWCVENYNSATPMNIGNPGEITIKELAETLMDIMEYDGGAMWDLSKPEGQHRKPSSNSKFINLADDYRYTDLRIGLEKTVDWFIQTYPNVRGVEV